MKQNKITKEQKKKERMIKYAASLGVTLTVSDKPSETIHFPDKVEKANWVVANMKNMKIIPFK
jgi:hypothetical protein